jgi:uncharacterized protein (DUF1778 family)
MPTASKRSQHATTIRFDDEYTLLVIDKAAALLNQTRTGFLLSVARERAEEVIKERAATMQQIESLILSPVASLDVAKTLLDSPKPNPTMEKAMKNYKKSKIAHKG